MLFRSSIFKLRHSNEDYVEPHHKIIDGSFKFLYDSAGVSYWKFRNDFRCKMPNMPSNKRYWRATVDIVIGYDSNYKITRYEEIHPFALREWSSEKNY